MIKGIDIGNYSTKDELFNNFESRISTNGNLLSDNQFVLENKAYTVGQGYFDTTYRKCMKDCYMELLFAMLCISNADKEIQLVLGLPLSQYKADKNILIDRIREHFILEGSFNGYSKRFIIQDLQVYPEGIGNVTEGVVVDIGGLTTDCCYINNINGKKKIENPLSIGQGTLNLYSDFINVINNRYSLNLKTRDAQRIIKKGLTIKGIKQDIGFAINIFKEYLESLIKELNLQYSLETNSITFTGGGSLLLKKPILNRLPYANIEDSSVFSNAKTFYKEGLRLWQN